MPRSTSAGSDQWSMSVCLSVRLPVCPVRQSKKEAEAEEYFGRQRSVEYYCLSIFLSRPSVQEGG
jgi:hypothetical protein